MPRKTGHPRRIEWMQEWCKKNDFSLELSGECGIGRECVGIVADDNYPDYMWFNNDYERIDNNGIVWCPEGAYHKHPCVAVLGRGEAAETKLYKWLKWLDKNNFKHVSVPRDTTGVHNIVIFLHGVIHHRLVREG